MAGFRAATCGMAGAAARWRERAAKGMSDDELAKALASEIGIFGGRSSPDGISLTYQGAGLKIWNSWEIEKDQFYDAPRGRHALQKSRACASSRQSPGRIA